MSLRSIPELEPLVEELFRRGASDLLLIPGEPPAYRVHGRLERSERDPLAASEIARIAAAALGEQRIARIGPEVAQETLSVRLNDAQFVNMSVARTGGELSVVLRAIRPFVYDVERLAVPDAIINAAESPGGLLIVTGPMGSGKTTTCYALLEHLNRTRDAHIVMLSYVLEYILEPKRAIIQHRQVGTDTPDMLSGIMSAVVQDMDVLFVGEIRDLEVFQRCLSVAEGLGILVVVQLHQPTPEAALQRMIDLQPDETRPTIRKMLAGVLRGALAQSLLPRLDGQGRVPAYGVLIPDDETRRAIVEGADLHERKSPSPPGCQDLASEIRRLSDAGTVSAEAAAHALSMLPMRHST